MKTKIFCDIADFKTIKFFNRRPFVDGFTTNPSLMRLAGAKNYKEYSLKILKICKKKRIGPSRQEDNRPLFYKKDMGVLARSGFDFEVSKRVMNLEKEEYLKIVNLL